MAVGAARRIVPFGAPLPVASGARALAVAGIARPERFFQTARDHGWTVVAEMVFRDHHWFTADDLKQIIARARESDADVILTTEKDAVRLEGLVSPSNDPRPQFAFLPIAVDVEPAAAFAGWLRGRLQDARES